MFYPEPTSGNQLPGAGCSCRRTRYRSGAHPRIERSEATKPMKPWMFFPFGCPLKPQRGKLQEKGPPASKAPEEMAFPCGCPLSHKGALSPKKGTHLGKPMEQNGYTRTNVPMDFVNQPQGSFFGGVLDFRVETQTACCGMQQNLLWDLAEISKFTWTFLMDARGQALPVKEFSAPKT